MSFSVCNFDGAPIRNAVADSKIIAGTADFSDGHWIFCLTLNFLDFSLFSFQTDCLFYEDTHILFLLRPRFNPMRRVRFPSGGWRAGNERSFDSRQGRRRRQDGAAALSDVKLKGYAGEKMDLFFKSRVFSDFAKDEVFGEAEEAFRAKADDRLGCVGYWPGRVLGQARHFRVRRLRIFPKR